MRPSGVIPFDPLSDRALCLGEAAEQVLPHALLLKAAKEPLDDPILLGCVRCDELLAQSVVRTGQHMKR